MTEQTHARSGESVRQFMADGPGFFGLSLTAMHTISRHDREELEAAAMSIRFDEQRERIPMLAKLAARQNITRLDDFDDVLPVCFEHTAYKSYPLSLLQGGRFDDLTRWLTKLTSHDLSTVDASRCETIDGWLDLLAAETELDPITSAGTTGKMSWLPKDSNDWDTMFRAARMEFLQEFGEERPRDDPDEKLHVVWPTFGDGRIGVFRVAAKFCEHFAKGDLAYFHPLYDARGSADIMFLAARMRAAANRGDVTKVDVPPSLLARRDELERLQQDMADRIGPFVEDLVYCLKDERVVTAGFFNLFYDIATKGLARGLTCRWAPNSILLASGGAKGTALPEDWGERVQEFFGTRMRRSYGTSEACHCFNMMCSHQRYHLQPGLIPFVLDPETSKPLPRKGVQIGRFAFFDVGSSGMWGGLVTGDRVEIDWDSECPCGRTTVHLGDTIERFSERQGGDDKITCAATPEAHAEAMEFLVGV